MLWNVFAASRMSDCWVRTQMLLRFSILCWFLLCRCILPLAHPTENPHLKRQLPSKMFFHFQKHHQAPELWMAEQRSRKEATKDFIMRWFIIPIRKYVDATLCLWRWWRCCHCLYVVHPPSTRQAAGSRLSVGNPLESNTGTNEVCALNCWRLCTCWGGCCRRRRLTQRVCLTDGRRT